MNPDQLKQELYQAHGGRADKRRVRYIVKTLTDPDCENNLDPDLNDRQLAALAGEMRGDVSVDCPLCSEEQDNLPDHLLDDH